MFHEYSKNILDRKANFGLGTDVGSNSKAHIKGSNTGFYKYSSFGTDVGSDSCLKSAVVEPCLLSKGGGLID